MSPSRVRGDAARETGEASCARYALGYDEYQQNLSRFCLQRFGCANCAGVLYHFLDSADTRMLPRLSFSSVSVIANRCVAKGPI